MIADFFHNPSIGDSFNARSTTIKELCGTFISNIYFESLCSPNNVIMIGPRGSGKTTLMRMLEVEALDTWNKEIADNFRERIDFSGVFIPTDRFWKTQYDKLSSITRTANENSFSTEILESIFIYHVLERLASVIAYRASKTVIRANGYKKVDIDKETESELVEHLSEIWFVTTKIKSLRGLSLALALKKQELSDYISRRTSNIDKSLFSELPTYIKSDLVRTLDLSIKIINAHFNLSNDKWAFLFDELELAPDNLVQPLVDAMRGGPENIIFKLALSPYHKGVSITNAATSTMKDQDLSFINLTGVTKKDGEAFAKELCSNVFHRNGLTNDIEEYFEHPPKVIWKTEFSQLYEKDPSFKEYIDKMGIDISKIDNYEEDVRTHIRKVQFIVQLRNYALRDNGKRKGRRRPASYYAGFKNICKAMEYNPRMLIGIMNMFIPIIKSEGTVSISKQLTCLSNYFESFRALLSTIAVNSSNKKYNTIYDLIKVVADVFRAEIYGHKFKSTPCGSLSFKNRVNSLSYREAIGYALNSGALIAEKNDIGAFHDVINIEQTKCRLSYIFAHQFGLLMTKQQDIDLMTILSDNARINIVEPFTYYTHQMELL